MCPSQVASTGHGAAKMESTSMTFNQTKTLFERGSDKGVYVIKTRNLPREVCVFVTTTLSSRRSSVHDTDDEVAAKRFSSAMHVEFEHERAMLQNLAHLRSDRITHLLASQQIHDDYVLFLPLAISDLRQYWSSNDPVSNQVGFTAWFVHEAKGLMHALREIHAMPRSESGGSISTSTDTHSISLGIIHGDIKPRNILVFRHQPDSVPILKWNDFGLSTWADTTQFTHTTRTYDSPENGRRLPLGKKSDIWSFGCVLLEFAIWLLHGNDAVEAFGDKRSMRTPGSGLPLKDDHFYTLVYEEKRAIGATVRHAVVECLKDIRQDRRCVGVLGRVVRLLEEDMLLVDVDARSNAQQLANILSQETN